MPNTMRKSQPTSGADDFVSDEFAIEPQHNDPSVDRYEKGMHAYSNEDFDSAREYWQEALDLNPNNMEAQNGLARLEEKKSTEIQTPPPEYGLGLQKYATGDLGGAAELWQKAAAIDPRNRVTQKSLSRLRTRGVIQ